MPAGSRASLHAIRNDEDARTSLGTGHGLHAAESAR
jgi:hypothetical protein